MATGLETVGTARADSAPPSMVTVIIPCLNEAETVSAVVQQFRAALPQSRIIVVDNGSTDGTAERAREAGAEVLVERRRGKGYALLAGFIAARDSELFVMTDGDGTYPAESASALIAAAADADMVVGTRLSTAQIGALPTGHGLGNWLFTVLVRLLFGMRTSDLFSGYRVIRSSMLEASPLIAQGFEIEAELSLQALARGFRVTEVPVTYRARPGGMSKLRTFRDGIWILLAILAFFRDYRPLTFFGTLSLASLAFSLSGGTIVVSQYLHTGLVPRLPLAVLSMGLFLLSALLFTVGILLSSINRRAAELGALIRWHGE